MTKTNTCKAYQVSKGVKSTPNKTYRGVSPQACPSGAARVIDRFAMHPAWMCGEGPWHPSFARIRKVQHVQGTPSQMTIRGHNMRAHVTGHFKNKNLVCQDVIWAFHRRKLNSITKESSNHLRSLKQNCFWESACCSPASMNVARLHTCSP